VPAKEVRGIGITGEPGGTEAMSAALAAEAAAVYRRQMTVLTDTVSEAAAGASPVQDTGRWACGDGSWKGRPVAAVFVTAAAAATTAATPAPYSIQQSALNTAPSSVAALSCSLGLPSLILKSASPP
jgi:hypothetical protein